MADADKDGPAPAPSGDEGGGERFFSRWSRLKRETGDSSVRKPQERPRAADPDSPPPELPSLDELTFDSDFRQFFHPKVDENVRRAALKKLFADSRFNVMDGLDVYVDDYSRTEPMPAAMLAGLKQAQNILKWARGGEEAPEQGESGREDSFEAAQAGSAPLEPPETQSPGGGDPAVDARAPAPSSSGSDGPSRS